jgi:methyl-accepting chemotaxis protein
MSENPNDIFFDLYKQNIACYYNNKKILKIINEGTTNIPPTVSEMLIVYETNREKIKNFDEETYLNHHKMVKTILCKLFNKSESKQQSLFGDIQSNLNVVKSEFLKYMDNAAGLTSSVGKSLSETSSNISSKLPSLELMTDEEVRKFGDDVSKEVSEKVREIGDNLSRRANETMEQGKETLHKWKEQRKIREDYTKYLDTIAEQIFHGYNAPRR